MKLTGIMKAKIVIEKAPERFKKLPNLGMTIENRAVAITIIVRYR